MRFSRHSLLVLLTVAALGVLTAVALASAGDTAPPTASPAVASSDDDGTADQGPGDVPATPRDAAERRDDDRDRGRHGADDGPRDDMGDDRRHDDLEDNHGNRGPGSSNSGHGGGGHSGRGGGED